MAEIDNIADISISADSATPSRQGFTTMAIAGYHTLNTDVSREYDDLPGMISDGFTVNSPLYRAAAAAFKQKTRVKKVLIVRLTTPVAWTMEIVPTTFTTGAVISLTLVGVDGVEHPITRTCAGVSLNAEATALAALIDPLADIAATALGSVVTCVGGTSGTTWYVKNLKNCTQHNITPDASVDADLNTLITTPADFYGIATIYESKANLDKLVSWAQANRRLAAVHSADDLELTGGGLIASAYKAATDTYALCLWSRDTINYPAVGWLAFMLTKDPGRATFVYKSIAGVAPDSLSSTQKTNLENSNWNFYMTVSGRNVTLRDGKVASGEFADVIIFIDWLRSEMQADVFDALSKADKIPFTDAGGAVLHGIIMGVLEQGVARTGLDGGNPDAGIPSPVVNIPLVSEIPLADRNARKWTGTTFGARLAGAMHHAGVQGNLFN